MADFIKNPTYDIIMKNNLIYILFENPIYGIEEVIDLPIFKNFSFNQTYYLNEEFGLKLDNTRKIIIEKIKNINIIKNKLESSLDINGLFSLKKMIITLRQELSIKLQYYADLLILLLLDIEKSKHENQSNDAIFCLLKKSYTSFEYLSFFKKKKKPIQHNSILEELKWITIARIINDILIIINEHFCVLIQRILYIDNNTYIMNNIDEYHNISGNKLNVLMNYIKKFGDSKNIALQLLNLSNLTKSKECDELFDDNIVLSLGDDEVHETSNNTISMLYDFVSLLSNIFTIDVYIIKNMENSGELEKYNIGLFQKLRRQIILKVVKFIKTNISYDVEQSFFFCEYIIEPILYYFESQEQLFLSIEMMKNFRQLEGSDFLSKENYQSILFHLFHVLLNKSNKPNGIRNIEHFIISKHYLESKMLFNQIILCEYLSDSCNFPNVFIDNNTSELYIRNLYKLLKKQLNDMFMNDSTQYNMKNNTNNNINNNNNIIENNNNDIHYQNFVKKKHKILTLTNTCMQKSLNSDYIILNDIHFRKKHINKNIFYCVMKSFLKYFQNSFTINGKLNSVQIYTELSSHSIHVKIKSNYTIDLFKKLQIKRWKFLKTKPIFLFDFPEYTEETKYFIENEPLFSVLYHTIFIIIFIELKKNHNFTLFTNPPTQHCYENFISFFFHQLELFNITDNTILKKFSIINSHHFSPYLNTINLNKEIYLYNVCSPLLIQENITEILISEFNQETFDLVKPILPYFFKHYTETSNDCMTSFDSLSYHNSNDTLTNTPPIDSIFENDIKYVSIEKLSSISSPTYDYIFVRLYNNINMWDILYDFLKTPSLNKLYTTLFNSIILNNETSKNIMKYVTLI